MTSASPLRLGVLGCANIARQFLRDTAGCPDIKVAAVASRQIEKAQEFSRTFNIAQAYGSYEALLADASVEAVYIPLPNDMHAIWAIKAAQAGKHVLCEKPLTLSLREAKEIFDVAQKHGVMVLEAYPYYFQPQTGAMLSLLNEGVIGQVQTVHASFGFTLPQGTGNIRWKPEAGGGAMLDAGSYPLSLIRLVFGQAPQKVYVDARWIDSGVDIGATALLRFADGRQAFIACAMDMANHRRGTIVGSQGTIETEYLNHTARSAQGHPYGYLPSQLRVRRGIANTVPFEDIITDVGSGFRFAAQAFAKVVRSGDHAAIGRAAQASKDIAATLEAMQQSARTGQWVQVQQCED
jgi:predicted dehydrogenase